MIGKLLYLCPVCNDEDCLVHKHENISCVSCKTDFPVKNNKILFQQKFYSTAEFYDFIKNKLSLRKLNSTAIFRESGASLLRQGTKRILFQGFAKRRSQIECPEVIDRGKLSFSDSELIFTGEKKTHRFQKKQLLSFTTNSKYFEFKFKDVPFYQIYFESESPLKYQDLCWQWITEKNNPPIEHQPQIRFHFPEKPPLFLKWQDILKPNQKEHFGLSEFFLHLVIGLPIKLFLKLRAGLQYEENGLIPMKGPFILLMNHESYLDPILISTLASRRIGFLTKSTSFSGKILQWVFRSYRSIPNRRYETDPQVIRHALFMLRNGYPVGIFPEGERCWDGRLLQFKLSTIRFLLSVEVPIVLVKISGAYDLLPRWSHAVGKGKINIEVMRSFTLLPGKWTVKQFSEFLTGFYFSSPA